MHHQRLDRPYLERIDDQRENHRSYPTGYIKTHNFREDRVVVVIPK
jgi:hypothetical protein